MGDNAHNCSLTAHRMAGTGGFDLTARIHHGAQNLDADSLTLTKAEWAAIVNALPGGNQDFDAACTPLGAWYADRILANGLRDLFRGLIADLVSP